jgi:hypothetical protein
MVTPRYELTDAGDEEGSSSRGFVTRDMSAAKGTFRDRVGADFGSLELIVRFDDATSRKEGTFRIHNTSLRNAPTFVSRRECWRFPTMPSKRLQRPIPPARGYERSDGQGPDQSGIQFGPRRRPQPSSWARDRICYWQPYVVIRSPSSRTRVKPVAGMLSVTSCHWPVTNVIGAGGVSPGKPESVMAASIA